MKVFGVEEPVRAFLTTWIRIQRSSGQLLRLGPNPTSVLVTYVTRETVSKVGLIAPTFPLYSISRATTHDIELLSTLYMRTVSPRPPVQSLPSSKANSKRFQKSIMEGLIWVCRVNGDLSAFAEFGRVTPRSITIKSMHVRPGDRLHRVAAEAMLLAITRYYLGVPEPSAIVSMPPGPPFEGVKERVGLIAADRAVTELARTLGFCLPSQFQDVNHPTGGIDPAAGKPGWYRSIWLESELDTGTSSRAWGDKSTQSTSV